MDQIEHAGLSDRDIGPPRYRWRLGFWFLAVSTAAVLVGLVAGVV